MDYRPLYALIILAVVLAGAYVAYRLFQRRRERRSEAAAKAHSARVTARWESRPR